MRPANDIERYVDAQEHLHEAVLRELRDGRKTSHWMWFVFPQLRGLGRSNTAHYYGIASADEARAYLAHPLPGPRLRACVSLVLAVEGRSLTAIFGAPDDVKFRSSMTLFAAVAPDEPLFRKALDKYCDAEADPLTLERLRPAGAP